MNVGIASYLVYSEQSGGADFCQSYEDLASGNPASEHRVRTYLHCVNIVGTGKLRHVSPRELNAGSKYLVHADGKEDEPHCVSMCISPSGDVAISDSNYTYAHTMSTVRDILADSVDNPVVFEYVQDTGSSFNSSQTYSQDVNSSLLNLSAGY